MVRKTSDTPTAIKMGLKAWPAAKGVNLLIADGGEGDHHHVEAVEPRPALDDVEADETPVVMAQKSAKATQRTLRGVLFR